MPSDSVIHNTNIIEMINHSPGFSPEDHCFVLRSETVYEKTKQYGNCEYNSDVLKLSVFRELSARADVIILHSQAFSWWQLYFIPRRILKKSVWVVWGHDLYCTESSSKLINVLKDIRWEIERIRLRHFRAIGIGFKYDAIRIRTGISRKIPILNMPYFQGEPDLEAAVPAPADAARPLKVMLGHSAYPFLKHDYLIDKLSRFKNENLVISLVLNYGHPDYAEKVAAHAAAVFGEDKVEVIDRQLDYKEYLRYIQSVDVAVFDFKHQSALGNFYLLLLYGKKIYLNPSGILYECVKLEGGRPHSTEDLDRESFQEVAAADSEAARSVMQKFAMYYFEKPNAIENWRNSLKYLEG